MTSPKCSRKHSFEKYRCSLERDVSVTTHIHSYPISDEFLGYADNCWPAMTSVCYQSIHRKEPAMVETALQAKPEERGAVLISSVILRYLCLWCPSVPFGHNTTRDTRWQFQRAQPCTVSAACTATNGRLPKHDTWLGGGDKSKQCNL